LFSAYNVLTGPVPSELGMLLNVEKLYLCKLSCARNIHLFALRILWISANNAFIGPILFKLGLLVTVETLFLMKSFLAFYLVKLCYK
jgi:hypothetical protein